MRKGWGPLGDVTCRMERGTNRGIWTSAVLDAVSVGLAHYSLRDLLPPLYVEGEAEKIGNRMEIAAHRDYDTEVDRATAFMTRRTRCMRLRHALNAE